MENDSIYDYPGHNVLHDDNVVGYFTAALKAGVWAVRKHLNSDVYKQILGSEIPVDMEAPMEGTRYPYIHVMYQDNGFKPISLGESKIISFEEDGVKKADEFTLYKFEGQYRINIYATTILERERIADCCIGAIGIDRHFRKKLVENPYINIAPNMHTMSSPTSNESWGTPWDENVMTAFRQLSFNVVGEFCYRTTFGGGYISKIELDMLAGDYRTNATLQPRQLNG